MALPALHSVLIMKAAATRRAELFVRSLAELLRLGPTGLPAPPGRRWTAGGSGRDDLRTEAAESVFGEPGQITGGWE